MLIMAVKAIMGTSPLGSGLSCRCRSLRLGWQEWQQPDRDDASLVVETQERTRRILLSDTWDRDICFECGSLLPKDSLALDGAAPLSAAITHDMLAAGGGTIRASDQRNECAKPIGAGNDQGVAGCEIVRNAEVALLPLHPSIVKLIDDPVSVLPQANELANRVDGGTGRFRRGVLRCVRRRIWL